MQNKKRNFREIHIPERRTTQDNQNNKLTNTPKFANRKLKDEYKFPLPSQFDYENKLKPKSKNWGTHSIHSGKSDYQVESEWTNTSSLNRKVGKYTPKPPNNSNFKMHPFKKHKGSMNTYFSNSGNINPNLLSVKHHKQHYVHLTTTNDDMETLIRLIDECGR
jgi:hypothetical protein